MSDPVLRMPASRASTRGQAPRLVHVTTVPDSLIFLTGQVSYMKRLGYEVHAISSPGEQLDAFGAKEGITVHGVEMPRRITPLQDAVTVTRLATLLRQLRPTIVHAHTPKGGLLGTMAAALARVPVRIYHMRGLPMMTAKGLRRRLLTSTEIISCTLAHRVLCQSHSLREVAIAEGICPAERLEVLLSGSNGVDSAGRYNPANLVGVREAVRRENGIPPDALVFGFLGRLVRDKGVVEFADAWGQLREEFPSAHLLVAGPFEPQDPVPERIRRALEEDPRVHMVGATREPPRMYAAMDVLVLPTYREGFPNVPLEAAAMRLPVVATRIPGCIDAVEDGVTGILVPPSDSNSLADAMRRYAQSAALRAQHGQAGRARVETHFQRERIWDAVADFYRRLLPNAPVSSVGGLE